MPIARIENGAIAETRNIDISEVPAHKAEALGWKPLVYEGSGPTEQTIVEPTQIRIVRSYTREQMQNRVNAERDRRMSSFTFNGVVYDFDPLSRSRIDKAKTNAMAAIELGAQPNNYRWADPDIDFGWITAANGFTLMDAQTCLAFGLAAAAWEGKLIVAARTLKDQNPIPQDYAHDSHWPSS